MLDASNLPVYFKNLHELSDRATQFPWKPRAESDCAELAAELYRMIEQWEKKANKEPVFEHFCREMLAECFPGNAAYYMSPVCSRDTEIYGQARFVYTALLVVNLPYKTAGAISAALVACAAIGVASRKTLKKLEGDATLPFSIGCLDSGY